MPTDDIREAHFDAVCEMYPQNPDQEQAFRGADGLLRQYLLVQGHDSSGQHWHVTGDDWRELLRYQENDEYGWRPVALWNLNNGKAWHAVVKCVRGSRAFDEDVHAPDPEPELWEPPSIEQLQRDTRYHASVAEGTVDELIEYKNALEDAYGNLLDLIGDTGHDLEPACQRRPE
jgi:hypothetical protein